VIKTTVRFSEDEAVLVKEIARKRGVPVADYIRTSVLEDAFKEVKQTWTGRQ
jgi:predicted DNA binding CopG/RHH family protein